jgi:hypothetical protein
MKHCLIFLAILCIGLLFGCKKGPGEGGRASISGKVYLHDYNNSGIPVDSFYVGEHRVYLIYGDDISFSKEVRTNYDGTYLFNYLLPGNYTVFTYSECLNCPGKSVHVKKNTEINGSKQDKVLEDFIIDNY